MSPWKRSCQFLVRGRHGHRCLSKSLTETDYKFEVDLDRYPRENVHQPSPEENPLGGWAYRCTVKDREAPAGAPLEGRTLALKDCIALAGVPMMMGSSLFADYTPVCYPSLPHGIRRSTDRYLQTMDATIVTRILQAGATITGRAVCENLCHSGTSHSAASGVVHNPYAHGYSSGGSSSGSGAIVGGGAVDMAIGADQGGSVRIPAGWCGLYGLKPTFGLVPYTGVGSNEPTNDHLGPMTTTLLDNALLLGVIAGNDGIDDRSFGAPLPSALPDYHGQLRGLVQPRDLTGVKIGVIAESLDMPGMDPRVLATFKQAVEKFRELGATVSEISILMHKHGAAIWTGVSKAGGAANKMGITFGRRGYIMNDVNSHVAPVTQQVWDQLYPR